MTIRTLRHDGEGSASHTCRDPAPGVRRGGRNQYRGRGTTAGAAEGLSMLLPAVGRQQGRARIAWWSIVAILCLGIFLHLVPIYIIVITSLKSASEVLHFPPTWFPQEPTLAAWRLAVDLNYRDNPVALRLLDRPLYVFFANSMFIATFTLAIGIPITSFAAYANSKLQRGAVGRWS